MEPNISLPALVVGLVLCNGYAVFHLGRAMRQRADLQSHAKRVWLYMVGSLIFVDLVTLWLTGYLLLWVRNLLPA